VTLRPLHAADIPELTRIIETPAVARWWDDGAPWEEPDRRYRHDPDRLMELVGAPPETGGAPD